MAYKDVLYLKMKYHSRILKQNHSLRSPTEFGYTQVILNLVGGKFSSKVWTNQMGITFVDRSIEMVSK
jgi:hypothetical protein